MHQVALVPRWEYSYSLLDEISTCMHDELDRLRQHSPGTEVERNLMLSLESVTAVQQQLRRIPSLECMLYILLPVVLAVRAASAQITDTLPGCSNTLCELAVHLGSIAVDSAILAGGRTRAESGYKDLWGLLDQAKLNTDSKLRKLYPDITGADVIS